MGNTVPEEVAKEQRSQAEALSPPLVIQSQSSSFSRACGSGPSPGQPGSATALPHSDPPHPPPQAPFPHLQHEDPQHLLRWDSGEGDQQRVQALRAMPGPQQPPSTRQRLSFQHRRCPPAATGHEVPPQPIKDNSSHVGCHSQPARHFRVIATLDVGKAPRRAGRSPGITDGDTEAQKEEKKPTPGG